MSTSSITELEFHTEMIIMTLVMNTDVMVHTEIVLNLHMDMVAKQVMDTAVKPDINFR